MNPARRQASGGRFRVSLTVNLWKTAVAVGQDLSCRLCSKGRRQDESCPTASVGRQIQGLLNRKSLENSGRAEDGRMNPALRLRQASGGRFRVSLTVNLWKTAVGQDLSCRLCSKGRRQDESCPTASVGRQIQGLLNRKSLENSGRAGFILPIMLEGKTAG